MQKYLWLAKPYTIRFSQPEVILHSNLQIFEKKDQQCAWKWLMNTDPGQPAQTAQIDLNRYSLQMHYVSFSERMTHPHVFVNLYAVHVTEIYRISLLFFKFTFRDFKPFDFNLPMVSSFMVSEDLWQGFCVGQWGTLDLEVHSSSLIGSTEFFEAVPFGKTFQSHSLVLVKPRNCMKMWAVAVTSVA